MKLLSGWVDQAGTQEAAEIIQVMRDRPAMLKTTLGIKVHAEATKKIRGTDWEMILFSESVSFRRDPFLEFREENALFDECIEETARAIDLNEIPPDINYAYRMRIKELKELLPDQPLEERMVSLKVIMEMHDAIFKNWKQLRLVALDDGQEPEGAA